jgi:hypothetical protein
VSQILHIGFGKTATTFFQNNTLPYLVKYGLTYSSTDRKWLREIPRRIYNQDFELADLARIYELRSGQNLCMSYEGILTPPQYWDKLPIALSKVFPPQTKILISMRDLGQFFRAQYQQSIQMGNILRPEEYFCLKGDVRFLNYYNLHFFNLRSLHDSLRDYFESVFFFDNEFFLSPARFQHILKLSGIDLGEIDSSDFNENRRKENVSYSNFAMRATFIRERILNKIGLCSRNYLNEFYAECDCVKQSKYFNWRGLMTSVVSARANDPFSFSETTLSEINDIAIQPNLDFLQNELIYHVGREK